MKTRTLIALTFILLTLAYCASAAGAATNSVTLDWKPSSDTNVTQYRIYGSTNSSAPIPWLLVTNTPSTQTNVSFKVDKVAFFYYATSVAQTTNAGVVIERESDPSNVALDPWPNPASGLSISK